MAGNVIPPPPAGFIPLEEYEAQQANQNIPPPPAGFIPLAEYEAMQAEQPKPAQEEQGLLSSAWDMVTGESRDTQRAQDAPLAADAIKGLRGQPSNQEEQLAAMSQGDYGVDLKSGLADFIARFTSNDEEAADIYTATDPNLEKVTDETGNVFIRNKKTGKEAIINRGGIDAQDAQQMGMDAMLFTPAGRAGGVMGALLANAATQAVKEGAQSAVGGEFNPEEVALAGALGGGLKGVEKGVGQLAKLRQKAPEDATQALQAIEDAGITASTSDVLPSDTAAGKLMESIGEKVPFVGTGVNQAKRQEQRVAAVQDFTNKFHGDVDSVKSSLKAKGDKVKAAAVGAMNKAEKKVGNSNLVSDNTSKAIDTALNDLMFLPNGAERKGVDKGLIETLTNYSEDLNNSSTFAELRSLRTTFRDDIKPELGKSGTRNQAIEKQVYGAMTKDLDEVAKQNLTPNEFRQWKRGNNVYRQEAQKNKKSKIANLLKKGDELSESDLKTYLTGNDSVKRRQLYNSLDNVGRSNARGLIMQNIADKVGDNPNRFITELEKMSKGKDSPVEVFFKGRDKAEMKGLIKALSATKNAQDAATVTPTGQQGLPVMAGISAGVDLGGTLATLAGAGLLSKAYQSAPVRKMLMKMSYTNKNTRKFQEQLRELQTILNSSAQSTRPEEG